MPAPIAPTSPTQPGEAATGFALSTERIRALADQLNTQLAYFDTQRICRYANDGYRRPFESLGRAVVGETLSHLVQPDVRDTVLHRAEEALAGRLQEFEYELITPTGTRLFLEATYRPDVQDGQVVGFLAEIHDSTRHKGVESLILDAKHDLEVRVEERSQRLFESEERFRLMIEGLTDHCIYFIDAQGFITDWTESAERMHAQRPAQVLRQPLSSLIDAEQSPLDWAAFIDHAVTMGRSSFVAWQLRSADLPFWARTTLTAMRNRAGELIGLSVVTQDMSAQKTLEGVMGLMHREIEHGQDRSGTRASSDAEVPARASDLGALTALVGDDMGTPLRHIGSEMQALQQQLAQHLTAAQLAETTPHLQAITGASQFMVDLMARVQTYLRLGQTVFTPASTPLDDVVQAALDRVAPLATHPDLHWIRPVHWPTLPGHIGLLTDLLAHLLDNALKFSRHEPTCIVEMGWWAQNHADGTDIELNDWHPPCLHLWVRDNGVGFDSRAVTDPFRLFQRHHHSLEHPGAGTGLAICQRIVELHRGHLAIRSQPGQGCVVHVVLPLSVG